MNIEDLRAYCLSLPNATEDLKWGSDLCFCIKDKMFCVTDLNSTPLGVTFKTTPEAFDQLIEGEPFRPAKYLGRYKWVSLDEVDLIEENLLKEYIKKSYDLISKKK